VLALQRTPQIRTKISQVGTHSCCFLYLCRTSRQHAWTGSRAWCVCWWLTGGASGRLHSDATLQTIAFSPLPCKARSTHKHPTASQVAHSSCCCLSSLSSTKMMMLTTGSPTCCVVLQRPVGCVNRYMPPPSTHTASTTTTSEGQQSTALQPPPPDTSKIAKKHPHTRTPKLSLACNLAACSVLNLVACSVCAAAIARRTAGRAHTHTHTAWHNTHPPHIPPPPTHKPPPPLAG
jgi:hypothetical protein